MVTTNEKKKSGGEDDDKEIIIPSYVTSIILRMYTIYTILSSLNVGIGKNKYHIYG